MIGLQATEYGDCPRCALRFIFVDVGTGKPAERTIEQYEDHVAACTGLPPQLTKQEREEARAERHEAWLQRVRNASPEQKAEWTLRRKQKRDHIRRVERMLSASIRRRA